MAGVNVPLHAAEHFYIVTEPMAGVTRDLPVLRDTDVYIYLREEVGGLLMGGFEPAAKPWGMDGIPRGLQVLAAAGRLGALPRADGAGVRAHPRARDRAHPAVRQRAGELHARQSLHARRSAGAAELLRRRRLQFGRHRVRGGRRARPWPSGSSAASRAWTSGTSTSAASCPSRATPATCASARRRSSACSTPCTGPSASRRRRAACAARRCTIGSPPAAPCFGVVAGWERAELVRDRRRRAALRVHVRPPELVSRAPPPSTAPCARPSASSTSPRSPSSLLQGPDADRGAPAAVRQRRRRGHRPHRLHADAECARRHRVRPDGDPSRRRRLPGGHDRRAPPATTRTGSAAASPTRASPSPTSPRPPPSSA